MQYAASGVNCTRNIGSKGLGPNADNTGKSPNVFTKEFNTQVAKRPLMVNSKNIKSKPNKYNKQGARSKCGLSPGNH